MSKTEARKIYRFKITNEELHLLMVNFAHTNQYLEKEDLKEKYEEWLNEPLSQRLINEEEELLRRNEYDLTKTNIKQKIFKSIKYYHIKKLIEGRKMKQDEDGEKKRETSQLSKNVKFSREIISKIKEELEHVENFKPSACCDEFLEKHQDLLNKEKMMFQKQCADLDLKDFDIKFKKMFKNQWFMKFKK